MNKREAQQAAKVATANSIWDPEDEQKAQKAQQLREAADNMPDDASTETVVKPIAIW